MKLCSTGGTRGPRLGNCELSKSEIWSPPQLIFIFTFYILHVYRNYFNSYFYLCFLLLFDSYSTYISILGRLKYYSSFYFLKREAVIGAKFCD